MNKNISELNLHDASISKISYLLGENILELNISAFLDGKSKKGRNCVLKFTGVELINIPHVNPWGSSNFIHTAKQAGNKYIIGMQSGDMIKITASSFTLIE